MAAAFLAEFPFYLAPGFESVRSRLQERFSRPLLAAMMAASALLPYLIYAIPTGQFRAEALMRLALLVVVIAFWYVARPPAVSSDLAFLALVAAPVLLRFFDRIYTSPLLNIDIDILGKLMLIRLAAMAALVIRRVDGAGFGFWPSRREWKTGALHFAMFLPVGCALGFAVKLFRFQPVEGAWWKAPLIFAGMLWVVALSEEFFFRGLLQNWLERWTARAQVALVAASLVFGLTHLWFRSFPNWRFALVAAAAGWFYGRAYLKSGGIRAAMVAHALTNGVARTLGLV